MNEFLALPREWLASTEEVGRIRLLRLYLRLSEK